VPFPIKVDNGRIAANGCETRNLRSDLGLASPFANDGFQVSKSLRHRERIHFLSDAFTRFERGFKIMSGDLDGQRVGDDFARAIPVFDPGWQRQSNPYRSALNKEFDVHRIGMAGSDGNNQRLINAVNFLLRPAIDGMEVSIHAQENYSEARKAGQMIPVAV